MHGARIASRLAKRITLFLPAIDKNALAVPKLDQSRTAAELRLNYENSRRSDHDVIDIEPVPDTVMETVKPFPRNSSSCSATASSPRSPRTRPRLFGISRRNVITDAPVGDDREANPKAWAWTF